MKAEYYVFGWGTGDLSCLKARFDQFPNVQAVAKQMFETPGMDRIAIIKLWLETEGSTVTDATVDLCNIITRKEFEDASTGQEDRAEG